MRRRRNTWLAVLAILIVGTLAGLWLGRSVWTLAPSSPQTASILQTEQARQQREAAEAARKQQQLDERQQAKARRLADEDR
jgi:uncharacterized membrane protein